MGIIMESNYTLDYSIDSLIKAFNPHCKQVMNKTHFFKLMNLLDTRLKTQKIDIGLPGYWYQYGFYIEPQFLDAVLPRKFSEQYMRGNCIYPSRLSKDSSNMAPHIKNAIDSVINNLWKQFGYQSGYGQLAKDESYKVNAPYKFNTIFQEYIEIVNRKEVGFASKKEMLESILDNLLSEFPENDYPELYDIYLEWDDTTRLILDYVPAGKIQNETVNALKDLFWKTYSKGVRLQHNQNIPVDNLVNKWREEYEILVPDVYKIIEDIRKNVLSKHYERSDEGDVFVKQLMVKAYEMSIEV